MRLILGACQWRDVDKTPTGALRTVRTVGHAVAVERSQMGVQKEDEEIGVSRYSSNAKPRGIACFPGLLGQFIRMPYLRDLRETPKTPK